MTGWADRCGEWLEMTAGEGQDGWRLSSAVALYPAKKSAVKKGAVFSAVRHPRLPFPATESTAAAEAADPARKPEEQSAKDTTMGEICRRYLPKESAEGICGENHAVDTASFRPFYNLCYLPQKQKKA